MMRIIIVIVPGDSSGAEFESTLNDLKMDFTRAKEAFGSSIESPVFEALAGVGERISRRCSHYYGD